MCLYYEAGNFRQDPPYETGNACNNCDGDRTANCDTNNNANGDRSNLCGGALDSSFDVDGETGTQADVDNCDNGLGEELAQCPLTSDPTTTSPIDFETCVTSQSIVSDVDFSIARNTATSTMQITINGPTDRWFAVGFGGTGSSGSALMANAYAIIGSAPLGADDVQERILANGGSGAVAATSWTPTISNDGNTTTIVVERPYADASTFDFTNFLSCANDDSTTLTNAISATGSSNTFGFHIGTGSAAAADIVNECCTASPTTNAPTTGQPTTSDPTSAPTATTTATPTTDPPSAAPSQTPTTGVPTTAEPTDDPTTAAPSTMPTTDPTEMPSENPTTAAPTTAAPTDDPTTAAPTTSSPSTIPTTDPTSDPTNDPTADPTSDPANNPTTNDPSISPLSSYL